MTPTDPLYKNQAQFDETGDFEAIWQDFTGAGIAVGIYDDGVEYTHEDLDDNYDASRHFTQNGVVYDGLNAVASNDHGTAVTGIIGAEQGNGVGGVGVAWDVALTSVATLGSGALASAAFSVKLDAYSHAATFDIMSNSWGWSSNFNADYSALGSGWMPNVISRFEDVTETGRGGLGTVIVKSAGNDFTDSNGTGLNASRFTASIAATDWDGDKMSYSNHGANILLAAPVAERTTDLQGQAGISAADYTPFGGTSAAAPFISGVVALMLEANPALGWRDVQNILAITAQDTGSGFGQTRAGSEVADWHTNSATHWNGGAMTFSQDYGFGLVDGYAAVRMAEIWHLLHPTPATSANEVTHTASMTQPDTAVAAFATQDFTMSVSAGASLQIESVTVDVFYTFGTGSELRLELVSPDGASVQLYSGDAMAASGTPSRGAWSFGATAFLGVEAKGAWTLRAHNESGALLEITDYDIHFFSAPDTKDSVHHITADYAKLQALETQRGALTDTDGGKDALNFAAIADALHVDLSTQTGTVTGLGAPLAIDDAAVFEKVFTGDGADFIKGNAADNHIVAMRGNDGMDGGAGADALEGFRGNDVLGGGDGHDTLHGGDGDDALHGDGAVASTLAFAVDASGSGSLLVTDATTATQAAPLAIDGDFHIAADPDVSNSATNPSLTVDYAVTASRDPLHLTFTLTQTADVIFDVDATNGLDGYLRLFDDQGLSLATADDSSTLDPGSTSRMDCYMVETLDPGTYTIALGRYSGSFAAPAPLPGSSSGSLHITVVGHANVFEITGEAGRGHDHLLGEAGDDTLEGGRGRDTLDGGTGADWLDGGSGADTLTGGNGHDTLLGGGSADNLTGGEGDDHLEGNDSHDVLFGGAGRDSLRGDAGNDTLQGGAGDDTLLGATGRDDINGESGNDTLKGGNSIDTLRGGDGNDVLSGGKRRDWLYGENDDDSLSGGEGTDTLDGGAGHDRLSGGLSPDILIGGAGDDTLRGDEARDTLTGGEGDDRLTGGTGGDTFVFGGAFGQDVLEDFEVNNSTERIDLSGVSSITDLNDLMVHHVEQRGDDVRIDAGNGNQITLRDVRLSDLDADDFVF